MLPTPVLTLPSVSTIPVRIKPIGIPVRIRIWMKNKWKEEWADFTKGRYNDSVEQYRSIIYGELLGRNLLYRPLKKAESSIAIQLRIGKTGLAEFLYKRRVPGIETTSCTCGWRNQNVKHILLFCPKYNGRGKMFQEAGSNDIRSILTTIKGLKAAARWIIGCGILNQFSLAKE